MDSKTVVIFLEGFWTAWAFYWFIKAFGNKRTIYTQKQYSRFAYLIAGFLAIRLILFNTLHHLRLFHETIFTQSLGLLLCAAGLGFSIWARQTLGSNWSGLITLKENHELIRRGPYRYVRHPIYSALILAAAGTLLAIDPFANAILLLAFVIIALKLKSLGEEKILLQHFPQTYPQYKQDVKSLVPFVC